MPTDRRGATILISAFGIINAVIFLTAALFVGLIGRFGGGGSPPGFWTPAKLATVFAALGLLMLSASLYKLITTRQR